MQLRIVAHSKKEKTIAHDGLRNLSVTQHFTVQGSDDVCVINFADAKKKVFIAGWVEGIRTRQGQIVACEAGRTSLEKLFSYYSIEQCRDMLEGRFVLVVVNSDDECWITTDQFGRMDLYYHLHEDRGVWATDLSLLDGLTGKKSFNQLAMAHSLSVYGYRPPKRHTIYEGISRLGVKETVHIHKEQIKFQQEEFKPIPVASYGERDLNRFSDVMLESIYLRGSDKGNVVYCSSGWDSTAILACLVHLFGKRKVRAVIARLLYSDRSGVMNEFEIKRVKAVAEYFDIHLDIVDFDVSHQLPAKLEKYQELCNDHQIFSINCLTHGYLADFVGENRRDGEAVFAGEVSDGAFNLGFSQFVTIFHPVLSFREYSDKMASYLFGPTFLGLLQNGQHKDDPVYNLLRSRCGAATFDEPVRGKPQNRTLQLLSSFFLRNNRIPLWSLQNCSLLTKDGRDAYVQEMESVYLNKAAEEITPQNLYSWYLHLYNSFHWQSSTVITFPVTAQDNGFHLALPFWDSRIQEFLSAMPEDWGRGLDFNPTKYPLKWMLKNKIDYPFHLQVGPHSYQYDVDPAVTPIGEFMHASAFSPYFKKILKTKMHREVLSSKIFNVSYIDKVIDKYVKGEKFAGSEFNDLVSLSIHSMMGWGK